MTGARVDDELRPGTAALPQLDLSTLNGAELRRLLDASRERGHAAQSYSILEEMARRRERRAARSIRQPGEADAPRLVSIELGDPLDAPDPADVAQPENEDILTLDRPVPPSPAGRRGLPAATFAAGALLGASLGAWGATAMRAPDPPSPELAEFRAELAAVPTAGSARAPEAVQPEATTLPVVSTPAAPREALPASGPSATSAVARPPPGATAETTADAGRSPAPIAAEARADEDCARQATPADRVICEEPELQDLQRALRRAYAVALTAHEERGLLRERQLAWREARNGVTDPVRLTALYQQRIRRLEAATAEARRER